MEWLRGRKRQNWCSSASTSKDRSREGGFSPSENVSETPQRKSAAQFCRRKRQTGRWMKSLPGGLVMALVCVALVTRARAWVTLTQDGYAFEHKLLAQAGVSQRCYIWH
eukprot:2306075-Rhodomonas_salina.2